MISIIIILLLSSLLWVRHQYQKNISLKYQYRLNALRDKLSIHAIEGEVDAESNAFVYLDYCITKFGEDLSGLTFWSLMGLKATSSQNQQVTLSKIKLEAEISANRTTQQIDIELGRLLLECTFQKHRYSIHALLLAILAILGLASIYTQYKLKMEKGILAFRNESLLHYC